MEGGPPIFVPISTGTRAIVSAIRRGFTALSNGVSCSTDGDEFTYTQTMNEIIDSTSSNQGLSVSSIKMSYPNNSKLQCKAVV